jgi:hypothetical protein
MSTTIGELRAKWEATRVNGARLGASVSLAVIAADVLADLAQLADPGAESLISPREAAAASGVHVETIRRGIRTGQIPNYGTQRKPLVRASECPRKPGAYRADEPTSGARGAHRERSGVAQSDSSATLSSDVLALDVMSTRRGGRHRAHTSRSGAIRSPASRSEFTVTDSRCE